MKIYHLIPAVFSSLTMANKVDKTRGYFRHMSYPGTMMRGLKSNSGTKTSTKTTAKSSKTKTTKSIKCTDCEEVLNECGTFVDCIDGECTYIPDDTECANDVFANAPLYCNLDYNCVECLNDGHCDDSIGCTDDTCDTATGECIHHENNEKCPQDSPFCSIQHQGCVQCLDDSHCDATVQGECALASCSAGACEYTPDDSLCVTGPATECDAAFHCVVPCIGTFTALQAAVAADGTHMLCPDTTINVESTLTFSTNVTLICDSAKGGNCVLDGGWHGDWILGGYYQYSYYYVPVDGNGIFSVYEKGSLTLRGVTLQNGAVRSSSGGAISLSSGLLILDECTFHHNAAQFVGGAIYNSGGSVIVSGGSFFNNRATVGGAIYIYGSLSVTGSLFEGNDAYQETFGDGGAISIWGGSTAHITNGTFMGNTAGVNGGAIHNHDSEVFLNGGNFDNNTAGTSSGGEDGDHIWTRGEGTLSCTDVTYELTFSGVQGGGICVYDGTNIDCQDTCLSR
uniref:Right handed beta helix domain-containing protein n=1 Tax=Amphora coffeiformis TaxID=265554 RepID=A0A7S3L2K1_9STRA|mmetsp:Transcript_2167/g.4254  ORF Transcript_2167/g.4254 Transcript_2167/m.4254 type:complete len:510 (-) Transcript_2167:311-1840(-)